MYPKSPLLINLNFFTSTANNCVKSCIIFGMLDDLFNATVLLESSG